MDLKRGAHLKFIACGLVTAGAFAADLPIRDVTIYKHGVAFVERAGDLKAGETARLDFKAEDMNDVLKSLTITDRSGGKVAGVRYDASDPLEKRLADFPFSVGAGASLASFLDQAKGARLELKLGAENVAGTILSARVVKDEKANEREVLVLLLDSGDIRTFDLAATSTVRFPDAKLQAQLRDYLSLLNQSTVEGPAQRLYRRHGHGREGSAGQLYGSFPGVEIELSADVHREGRSHARRLGDCR